MQLISSILISLSFLPLISFLIVSVIFLFLLISFRSYHQLFRSSLIIFFLLVILFFLPSSFIFLPSSFHFSSHHLFILPLKLFFCSYPFSTFSFLLSPSFLTFADFNQNFAKNANECFMPCPILYMSSANMPFANNKCWCRLSLTHVFRCSVTASPVFSLLVHYLAGNTVFSVIKLHVLHCVAFRIEQMLSTVLLFCLLPLQPPPFLSLPVSLPFYMHIFLFPAIVILS